MKILKITGRIVLFLLIIVVVVLTYFTIFEYRPDPVLKLTGTKEDGDPISTGDTVRILTLNTGYGCLSSGEDFFMDGGTKIQPEDVSLVKENISGISGILRDNPSDVIFLQETDRDSRRSFHIDETEFYADETGMNSFFATNFKCNFVPYPFPPIGKVESGIQTLTEISVSDAERISLPVSFSWPVRTCNLKRCLLLTRHPLKDSDRELVLINFHLEAYDDGEGKKAQNRVLGQILEEEYKKGNYVIAGGDFNQTFPGNDTYPIRGGIWAPARMDPSALPDHYSFVYDDSYPTCRLLDSAYTGSYDTSQVYVIDGFIVSDNVRVRSTKVINTDFQYTDHQPVLMEVELTES